MPNGALWKFSTETGEQAGRVALGRFPATLQVAPGGHYAYVVNFNLYGEMVPSSVSVVYTDDMVEVRRIPTCVMPHGSRLSPDGRRQYSACMMNDALVEIDADSMAVARHFFLKKGAEHAMSGPGRHGHAASRAARTATAWRRRSPATSAARRPGRSRRPTAGPLCVACNKANDIVEIDVASWTLRRRIPAGEGSTTWRRARTDSCSSARTRAGSRCRSSTLATGKELARMPTTRKVPSGVVISPDDRYAFVTQEGVGSEPGTVDVIDLRALRAVASVDVGQQAGGIDFWKTEAPGR